MSIPAGPYYPTDELVAAAWLAQRVDDLTSAMVATTLPSDTSKWADAGFVQAQAVAGGRVSLDLPVRRPVVTLDFWAVSPGSNRPPWGLANRLVELVRHAVEAQTYGQPVTLGGAYLGARVQAVYAATAAARVEGDPSGYARYTQDLAIDWVLIP